MKFDIKPAKDFIVLDTYTYKTDSGLEVPPAKKGDQQIGIVYAVGEPGKEGFPIEIKKGDKIIFKKYMSNALYVPELERTVDIIQFEDVCAVLVEGK